MSALLDAHRYVYRVSFYSTKAHCTMGYMTDGESNHSDSWMTFADVVRLESKLSDNLPWKSKFGPSFEDLVDLAETERKAHELGHDHILDSDIFRNDNGITVKMEIRLV